MQHCVVPGPMFKRGIVAMVISCGAGLKY